MSVGTDLRSELKRLVLAGSSIQEVLLKLRTLKGQGVTRADVQECLESLRAESEDDAIDDRILEILDFVTGFCRVEDSVWSDS